MLIPRKPYPSDKTDFKHISLCNVVHIIITKVISNLLKFILPSVIFENQSALIQGKLINDNILVAYKLFHCIYGYNGVSNSMALKLDMSKAFDIVVWIFLKKKSCYS